MARPVSRLGNALGADHTFAGCVVFVVSSTTLARRSHQLLSRAPTRAPPRPQHIGSSTVGCERDLRLVVTAPDSDEGTPAERVAALRDARAAKSSCEHPSA